MSYRWPFRVLILLVAGVLAWLAPLAHNPDGSYHYSVALRIIEGRLVDSVELLYSPLVSWGMIGPMWLGVDAPDAFRLVNLVSLLAILAAVAPLTSLVRATETYATLAALLTGSLLIYFVVCLIGGDFLATAPAVWAVIHLVKAFQTNSTKHAFFSGALGGVAYLAKAMQLPIYLISVACVGFAGLVLKHYGVKQALKVSLGAILACLIVAAPWIIVLSVKTVQPLFSGQQLISNGTVSLAEYAPDSWDRSYPGISKDPKRKPPEPIREASLDQVKWRLNRIGFSLNHLADTSQGLLFGPVGWYLFLFLLGAGGLIALARRRENFPLVALTVFAIVHSGLYLYLWGPYLRYYFPVLPITCLLAVYAGSELYRIVNGKKLVRRFSAGVIVAIYCLGGLSVLRQTTTSIWNDILSRDDAVVEYALSIPELRASKGILTGNADDPYAGHIAARLGREYWNSIRPRLDPTPSELARRLTRWNVSQVLWFGPELAVLEEIQGITLLGKYEKNGVRFWIYNLNGEGSRAATSSSAQHPISAESTAILHLKP